MDPNLWVPEVLKIGDAPILEQEAHVRSWLGFLGGTLLSYGVASGESSGIAACGPGLASNVRMPLSSILRNVHCGVLPALFPFGVK